jgi:hypothetical protein
VGSAVRQCFVARKGIYSYQLTQGTGQFLRRQDAGLWPARSSSGNCFNFTAQAEKGKSTPVLQALHLQPGVKHPVRMARINTPFPELSFPLHREANRSIKLGCNVETTDTLQLAKHEKLRYLF